MKKQMKTENAYLIKCVPNNLFLQILSPLWLNTTQIWGKGAIKWTIAIIILQSKVYFFIIKHLIMISLIFTYTILYVYLMMPQKKICTKVCQGLVAGQWFSPVFSTNETDHHDITEIL